MPWTPSANAAAMLAVLKQYFTDAGFPLLQAGGAPGNGVFHEAAFDAFSPYFGGLVNGHTNGASVAWTAGATAGKIEIGTANTPAAPSGTFTSAYGCDEGGAFTFASGANTSSGVVFIIHFAGTFTNPPVMVFFQADNSVTGARHLFFNVEWTWTSTQASASFIIASAGLGNAAYTIGWMAKGAA